MTRTHLKTLFVIATGLVTSCGMEPSGGNSGSSAAATNSTTQQTSGVSKDKEETKAIKNDGTNNSADAVQAGVAVLPDSLAGLNTDIVAACHAKGFVYTRRTEKCSKTVELASSFACDNAGITDAFKLTGFQIDEALKAAESDGFSLDQCGETDSGRRIAYFVRADDDGTHSIREIETKLTIK